MANCIHEQVMTWIIQWNSKVRVGMWCFGCFISRLVKIFQTALHIEHAALHNYKPSISHSTWEVLWETRGEFHPALVDNQSQGPNRQITIHTSWPFKFCVDLIRVFGIYIYIDPTLPFKKNTWFNVCIPPADHSPFLRFSRYPDMRIDCRSCAAIGGDWWEPEREIWAFKTFHD